MLRAIENKVDRALKLNVLAFVNISTAEICTTWL